MVHLRATSWKPLSSAVVSERATAGFNEKIAENNSSCEVRKLYESIPRRIEAAQKAGGRPTTYYINSL